jgi:hypothetical protein
MNKDDLTLLNKKTNEDQKGNNRIKSVGWNPSMGDFKKNNSQSDSDLLRKDQRNYKIKIVSLVVIMVSLLIGSIIYFTI